MRRDLFEEEHEALRASFRAWLDKEVVPHHLEWEQAGIVPHELFAAAGRHGFLGMAIPEKYGGGGVDDFRYNLVIGEEVQAAGVGGAGLGLTLHNDICLPYFLRYCTDEQRERWLPGIASGELVTAIAMTEPGIGSDLASMSTTALARRRRLRRQRLQDLHHERDQRRPRHHRRQDRPQPAPRGDVADRPRAGHAGLRARPQPREARAPQPGHRRAVLHRRQRPPRQPPRRRGAGLLPARPQPPPGAPVDRRVRRRRGSRRAWAGPSTT